MVSALHNDSVLTLHQPGFCAVFGANDGNLLSGRRRTASRTIFWVNCVGWRDFSLICLPTFITVSRSSSTNRHRN
jgi:hypothetical protein